MAEVCIDEAIIEGVPVCPKTSLEDMENYRSQSTPFPTPEITEGLGQADLCEKSEDATNDDGAFGGIQEMRDQTETEKFKFKFNKNDDSDGNSDDQDEIIYVDVDEFSDQELPSPLNDYNETPGDLEKTTALDEVGDPPPPPRQEGVNSDAEEVLDEWFSANDLSGSPARRLLDSEADAGKSKGPSEWPCSSSAMLERIDPSLSPVLEEKYNWAQDHRDKDLYFHAEQVATMSREDLEDKLMNLQSCTLRRESDVKLSESLQESLEHTRSLVSAELTPLEKGSLNNRRRKLLERTLRAQKELMSAIDALQNDKESPEDTSDQGNSETCDMDTNSKDIQSPDHDVEATTKEELVKNHSEEIKGMQDQFREKYCRLQRDLIASFSERRSQYERQMKSLRSEIDEKEAALEGQYIVHEKELQDIAEEHRREVAGLLQKIRERDLRHSQMKRELESDITKLKEKLKTTEPTICKCCERTVKQLSTVSESIMGRVRSPSKRDSRVSSGKVATSKAPSRKSFHALTCGQEISKYRDSEKTPLPVPWCPRLMIKNKTGSQPCLPGPLQANMVKNNDKTSGSVQGSGTPSNTTVSGDGLPSLQPGRKSPTKTQLSKQSPKHSTREVLFDVKPPPVQTEH